MNFDAFAEVFGVESADLHLVEPSSRIEGKPALLSVFEQERVHLVVRCQCWRSRVELRNGLDHEFFSVRGRLARIVRDSRHHVVLAVGDLIRHVWWLRTLNVAIVERILHHSRLAQSKMLFSSERRSLSRFEIESAVLLDHDDLPVNLLVLVHLWVGKLQRVVRVVDEFTDRFLRSFDSLIQDLLTSSAFRVLSALLKLVGWDKNDRFISVDDVRSRG